MVCIEDTHLLAVSRRNFEAIVGAHSKAIISERVEFLRRFGFLRGMTDARLLGLQQMLTTETFSSGNTIYKQGDQYSKIYFIKTGEVEIFEENNAVEAASFLWSGEELPRKQRLVGRKKNKQKIRLFILGESAYFGAVEPVKKKDRRDTSAHCISEEAQLLTISVKVRYKRICDWFLIYHPLVEIEIPLLLASARIVE